MHLLPRIKKQKKKGGGTTQHAIIRKKRKRSIIEKQSKRERGENCTGRDIKEREKNNRDHHPRRGAQPAILKWREEGKAFPWTIREKGARLEGHIRNRSRKVGSDFWCWEKERETLNQRRRMERPSTQQGKKILPQHDCRRNRKD